MSEDNLIDVMGLGAESFEPAPPDPLGANLARAHLSPIANRVQNVNLADSIGSTLDYASVNRADIVRRRALEAIDPQAIRAQTPAFAEWAAKDEANAVMSVNDMGWFQSAEHILRSAANEFEVGVASSEASRLDAYEALARLTGTPGLNEVDKARLSSLRSGIDSAGSYSGTGGIFSDAIISAAQIAPSLLDVVAQTAKGGAVGAGVGSLAGSVVPGVGTIAGLISGATTGASAGAIESSAMQNFGAMVREFSQLKDENGNLIDQNTADIAAAIATLPVAALDRFSNGKMTALIPDILNIKEQLARYGLRNAVKIPSVQSALMRGARDYATSVGTEAVTEGLQQGIQATARYLVNPDANKQFDAGSIMAEMGSAAYQAGLGTAVIGVPGGAINTRNMVNNVRAGERDPEVIAQRTASLHEHMQSKTAQESLNTSAPRLRDFMKSADGGAQVFIDPKPMQELFQSLPDDTRKVLLDALPGFQGQLEEAAAADTDIIMRRGDYAALFASQPWSEPLIPHVRENQLDVSAAELKALIENKDIQNDIDQAPSMERLETRLQRRLQDSIQNAGVTPAIASDNSRLLERFIGRTDRLRSLAGETGDISAKLERALSFRRSASEYTQPERVDELTQHLTNIKARMATEKAPARVSRKNFPVLNYIVKTAGGIDPSGSFGRELAAQDVTPKTHPWIFKTGGVGEIDALDATSLKNSFPKLNLETSELGKYSVNDLHEIIRQELKAPTLNKEETERSAAEDNLMSLLDEGLGLSLKEIEALTPDKLRALLAEYEAGKSTDTTLNQFDEEASPSFAKEMYEKDTVPDGWYVHGRARRQDLETGRLIQLTKDWGVADQYAGTKGSKWMVRPSAKARVFDLTDENTGDMDAIVQQAISDFESGDSAFSGVLDGIEGSLGRAATKEDIEAGIRSNFAPDNIVDSARAYDSDEWMGWFYEKFGDVDFIETPDGAIAININNVDKLKVLSDKELNTQEGKPTPYTAPIITVDGKERPTTNSNGKPIAATKEGLENFWRWFSESRVTDAEGKPLVVYHGTNADFDSFDNSMLGITTGAKSAKLGHFFVDDPDVATGYAAYASGQAPVMRKISEAERAERKGDFDKYDALLAEAEQLEALIRDQGRTGDNIYPVYLSIPSPRVVEANGKSFTDNDFDLTGEVMAAKKIGADGVIINNLDDDPGRSDMVANHFVTFSPNQIKSATGNNGNFSREDNNILHQAAWHGSPHRFEKFTTGAMGTGEGAQAFGWGLYFAGKKDVAEWYRKKLASGEEKTILQPEKLESYRDTLLEHGFKNEDIDSVKQDLAGVRGDIGSLKSILERKVKDKPDYVDMIIRELNVVDAVISKAKTERPGALYEVNIPEDDTLLLWDKPLSEQSDKVKSTLELVRKQLDKSGVLDDYLERLNADFEELSGKEIYAKVLRRAHQDDALPPDPKEYDVEISNDEAASRYLNSIGIHGIKYLDGTSRGAGDGSFNYVIFDDSAIEIASVLYQSEAAKNSALFEKSRGSIRFDTMLEKVVISLSSGANLSTMLHEFGHYAALLHRQTAQIARDALLAGKVTDPAARAELEQVIKDWDTLKEKLGVVGDKLTVDQEEQIAKWFEQYLREGKSPIVELNDIFATFKSWLFQIYKTIKDLGKPINDDVRQVFDRWIASDEEIKAAQSVNIQIEQIAAQFDMLDATGLSKEQAEARAAVGAKVARLLNKSGNRASEALLAEVLKEESKKQTEEYKADYAKTLEEVTKAADESRVYAAQDHIKAGHQMDAKLVEKVVGKDIAKRLPNGLRGGRSSPDLIAMQFGYIDGAEMIREIVSNVPKKVFISQETERLMQARHGNMLEDGRAADRARILVANDEVGEAIELLVKTAGEKKQTRRLVKAAARQRMLNTRYADITPGKYSAARDKALRAAYAAGTKAKGGEAAQHLWKAMLNHELLMAANQAKADQAKAQKLYDKINKKDTKLPDSWDAEYVYFARYLLANAGLSTNKGFNPNKWLVDAQERNPELMGQLAEAYKDFMPEKNWKNMTALELSSLHMVVQNIIHIGRENKAFVRAGEKTTIENALSEIVQSLQGQGYSTVQPPLPSSMTMGAKAAKVLYDMEGSLVRIEALCKHLDGGNSFGPMSQSIYRPISDAVNRGKPISSAFITKLAKVMAEREAEYSSSGSIAAPELFSEHFNGVFRNKWDVIACLLNYGNASSATKLIDGYKWNEADLLGVFNKHLNARDVEFVQRIWDVLNEVKPYVKEEYYQRTGLSLVEIEPRAFDLHGQTWRGGYYPAAYSREHVANSKIGERADLDQSLFGAEGSSWPAPNKGSSIERTGYVGPIDLNPMVSIRHVEQSIHRWAVAKDVRQTARLVNRPEFQSAMAAINPSYRGLFMPWLRAVARDTVDDAAMTSWDKAAKILRNRATVMIMGLNLRNAMQNLSGYPIVSREIGGKYFMEGMASYAENPQAATDFIFERSAEMKMRYQNLDREQQEVLRDIAAGKKTAIGKLNSKIQPYAFALSNATDALVSRPAWLGAYKKAKAENKSDADAAYYADSVVRLNVGIGNVKDVASLQRGNQFARTTLVMFYSYMNMVYNLNRSEFLNLKRTGASGIPSFLAGQMLVNIIPNLIAAGIVDALGGGGAGADDEDWMWWYSRRVFSGMFGLVPIVGDFGELIIDEATNEKFFDRFQNPVFSMLGTIGSAVIGDGEAFFQEDPNYSQVVKTTITAMAGTFGTPINDLRHPLGTLADWAEGDSEPVGVWQAVQQLMGAPPPKD